MLRSILVSWLQVLTRTTSKKDLHRVTGNTGSEIKTAFSSAGELLARDVGSTFIEDFMSG
jgi:hypothetical protein